MPDKRIRVVIAKVGLDGHDRGAKLVARYLKDAGMEVIYTGQRLTVDAVAATVVQEDADVLGMSFLAGDHLVLVPKVMQALKAREMEHVLVLLGGIIMRRHEAELKKLGVSKIFYAGTDPNHIVSYIRENVTSHD